MLCCVSLRSAANEASLRRHHHLRVLRQRDHERGDGGGRGAQRAAAAAAARRVRLVGHPRKGGASGGGGGGGREAAEAPAQLGVVLQIRRALFFGGERLLIANLTLFTFVSSICGRKNCLRPLLTPHRP